jgi:CheY-like chemotaxis protein
MEKVILLVEDNPDDVILTRMALKKAHINNKLVIARDGEEALDYLFRRGAYAGGARDQVPELILLDLKLPKLNGLEVLKQIRSHKKTRCLPVVILTSSLEEKDIIESYELGCNSYVQKPVDFDRFVEAIKEMGLYWLVLTQPPPPSIHDNNRAGVS